MIGRLLGGRYSVLENVDSGGMAYIFKAFCKKTHSTVAVKVLKEEFSQDEEYVKRFKKEAEAAFSIEHPGIVHVTDVGCDNGTYYMVMEYVEGRTLKSIIDESGSLGETEAIEYAMQICDALEAAHCEGIIHRDIKPQNILVRDDGCIKLTDFGIATSVTTAPHKDAQVMGSVFYISPEQARGDKVDLRTDIYSLGIVLYEMLTGCLPHTGDKTVAVALKHINEKLTPPAQIKPSISSAVNNIVVKAMSKSPKDRYRSANALKSDLERALEEPGGNFVDVPRQALSDEAKAHLRGKHKVWKVCVLAALVLIAGGAVYLGFFLFGQSSPGNTHIGNVTGLRADIALTQLEKSGLHVDITYESSETVDEGVVISQSVAGGTKAVKGTAVLLVVSSGPAGLVMPDLVGMDVEEAQAKIEAMGLSPADITYEVREDVLTGKVVSQMPEADDDVTPDELITLTVSGESAEESSLIPTMKNMPVDQAVNLLTGSGFTNCLVYEQDSDSQEGIVSSQSPVEGAQAFHSDEVILYISRFSTKAYSGTFNQTITLPDTASKIRIVLTDYLNGSEIRFVVGEASDQMLTYRVSLTLSAFSAGKKTITVYINNVETYSYEVSFS